MKNKGIILAIVLTVALGRIQYGNHVETWYDLPMGKVIERADVDLGVSGMYSIREDGAKCYGPWVIVASHPSIPRYSFVETSLGQGIILDRHEMPAEDLYDIATTWKE